MTLATYHIAAKRYDSFPINKSNRGNNSSNIITQLYQSQYDDMLRFFASIEIIDIEIIEAHFKLNKKCFVISLYYVLYILVFIA